MSITTWGEAVDYCFAHHDAWRHGAGIQAAQINTNHFTRLRGLSFPVSKITAPTILQVSLELEEEGKSNATINRIISAVSKPLNFGAQMMVLPTWQPCKFVRRKEADRKPEYYTKAEVAQLAACAVDPFQRDDLKDVINFAAYTGLRRGDVYKIKAKDIDLGRGLIHVGGRSDNRTKSGKYRSIPIHTHIIEMLAKRIDGVKRTVAIFGDEWGNPTELSRAFMKVKNFLDFDEGYDFHSLRHSFATWHVEAGTPIITLQNLMGHSRIETTLVYAKATDNSRREAMANI